MAMWRLETLRRVPGRDQSLASALLQTVEAHILPLAIELGDIAGQPPFTVAVRPNERSRLFISRFVPLDRSDTDMPVFSSDRLSDGALILLGEGLCMQAQVLLSVWSTLVGRLAVLRANSTDTIGTMPMPSADTEGKMQTYAALAHRSTRLVNSIMKRSVAASADHEREPFVRFITALADTVDALAHACRAVYACQTRANVSTSTAFGADLRLVVEKPEMLEALCTCASQLSTMARFDIPPSGSNALDARIANWRADVEEVHAVYAFFYLACGSCAAGIEHLRARVLATSRVKEQGLADAIGALGPRHATPHAAATDQCDSLGVPIAYSALVNVQAERPTRATVKLSAYKIPGDAGQHTDTGWTTDGFRIHQAF